MRFSSAAIMVTFFMIMLAVSSGGVWIPEHRCVVKTGGQGKCNGYKCMVGCSEKGVGRGRGRCRGKYCICTYYCHQPPKPK